MHECSIRKSWLILNFITPEFKGACEWDREWQSELPEMFFKKRRDNYTDRPTKRTDGILFVINFSIPSLENLTHIV